jgi:hypothetical protein
MKRNRCYNLKNKNKLKSYEDIPVNQGFYNQNLLRAKKLYLTEYDRIKQQINKKREDYEFQKVLSNYYNDFNKLSKKHPYLNLNKCEKYDEPKDQNEIDFNQYEIKKKNINALFFKYDNKEDELNFDITDELIESMNDGDNKTLLNCFEIKEDYKRRLALNKMNNINDISNDNLLSEQKNENFSIISEQNKNKMENKKNRFKDEIKEEENLESHNLIYNLQSDPLKKNQEKEIIINDIVEEENELVRYKKYLKENKYPVFEKLINPFIDINYIPPTFIPVEQKSEKDDENEQEENNSYNSMKQNQAEILNEENQKSENIDNNFDDLNLDKQENLQKFKKESEIDENELEDYDNYKFDEEINNNNINNNEDDNKLVKENKNGDLPMLNQMIKSENKYLTFGEIINPYNNVDYIPPNVFNEPDNKVEEEERKQTDKEEIKENKSKYTVELAMENDLKNSENNNLLQDKIKDNENPMLDDMIRNNKFDYNYNIFSNNNPGYNNDENDKEINNINDTNKQDRVLLNQFGINNGNEFVSVQDMINKDYQNNNNNYGKEVIKEENEDEDNEYADFEVDN